MGERLALAAIAGVVACTPSPALPPDGSAPATPFAASPATAATTADPPPSKTTPGTVACGAASCDLATEVCCEVASQDGTVAGRCVAKTQADDGPSLCCPPDTTCDTYSTTERWCDEVADCATGQRCCHLDSVSEYDHDYETCEDQCLAETCLAGSRCVNGNACAAKEGRTVGLCPLQIEPPDCDKTTCERGQVCCWNVEAARGRCVAPRPGDEPWDSPCDGEKESTFACTSLEQCNPYDCNTVAGVQHYRCGGVGFISGVLCATIKDCPQQIGALGSGDLAPKVTGCAPGDHLPPGVRACTYE